MLSTLTQMVIFAWWPSCKVH